MLQPRSQLFLPGMCHVQKIIRLVKGVASPRSVKARYVQNSKAMHGVRSVTAHHMQNSTSTHGVSAAELLVLTVKALDSARALRQTARILARRWTMNMGAKAAETSRVERPAAAMCLFTLPCRAPIVPNPRISSRCLHALMHILAVTFVEQGVNSFLGDTTSHTTSNLC